MLLVDTVRTELVYGETEGDVNKNCVGCRSFVMLFRLYNDGTVRYNTGKSNKQFPALSIPFEENKKKHLTSQWQKSRTFNKETGG